MKPLIDKNNNSIQVVGRSDLKIFYYNEIFYMELDFLRDPEYHFQIFPHTLRNWDDDNSIPLTSKKKKEIIKFVFDLFLKENFKVLVS